MQTEAILLALTGLISVVVTSPVVGKHSSNMLQPSAVAAESGPLNTNQTVQESRIQRLQHYCSVSSNGAGCFAYKEMIEVAVKNKVAEVEHVINEELSHTLSEIEDDYFCGDLSNTLKRLPPNLYSHTLEPFKRIPTCVGLCYVKESGLTDVCRALNVGYKLIIRTLSKEEIKHQSMEVPVPVPGNKPESIKNQSGFAKIVPAVAEEKKPATVANKDGIPLAPIGNDTEKFIKKDNKDKNSNSAVILTPLLSDSNQPNKPKAEGKAVAVEADAGPKIAETAPKEQVPIPDQPPQEAVVPDKNEGSLDLQQGEIDDAGGDIAPFEDEPKQTGNKDAKSATQPGYENSDESEGIASAEDINENGDDLESNGFQSVGKQPVAPEKVKQDEFSESSKASDIVSVVDPFYDQKDSNFFSYFLFAMFSCAMLYVAYHNKSKLLALVVEGRRTSSGRGGFSKGRKHTAAYRKLDSNLEEAITSGSGTGGHSSSQIIY
ncbi:uncharacterized protein LOC125760682 [Anopheles funestus]|uniref:uncharacterized protein LOC125760682 n=1 Tax=Anopheles funestus TaxID=62324 RepID=UPI0020C629FD|nr:uncharacterized protein LOC125760682 [Anopheles funestus]